MSDFLPVSEDKLVAWFQKFLAGIKQHAATLGLTDGDIRPVENDSNVLSHLVSTTDAARASAPAPAMLGELERYKDLIKNGPNPAQRSAFPAIFTPLATLVPPGVVPRLRALIARIKGASGYNSSIGEALDLPGLAPGAPADALPTGDNALMGWYKRFLDVLPQYRQALGLSDADVQAAKDDHDALTHLVTGVDQALNDHQATPQFQELVTYKNLIRDGADEKLRAAFPAVFTPLAMAAAPGILPRLMAFIDRIKGLPGFTSLIGERLGFLLPVAAAAAAPIPPSRPEPRVAPVPVAAADAGTRWMWPGLLGLLALGLVGWWLWSRNATTEVPVSAIPPTRPVIAANRKPEDVLMLYELGAKEWLEPAAEEFNKQNAGKGQILLTALGSREGRDNILYDKDKVHPVIWTPADRYWVDKMKMDAANTSLPSKSGATVGDGKGLLGTYLVLVMRDDRARSFEAAMQKPEYKGHPWKLMRDLATKGWSTAGASGDWGKLKLTQSNPTQSNSAMAALALMYQEYARDNPGKDYNAPEFLAMMGDIEGNVDAFADTTSNALKAFLDSPDKHDIAIVYESDAFRAIKDGAKGIRVVYPEPTVEIVLPATIVQGSWVTKNQEQLGQAFVDYLRKDDVQERAIAQGYRPVNASLQTKVGEAYGAADLKDAGLQAMPNTQNAETDTKTKEGLIYNWDQWDKKRGGQ